MVLHEGRGCGGVERDDVMNSSEYHKCMGELYFSRMLLLLMYILVILIAEHCGMISRPIVLLIMDGLLAIGCGVTSFLERRRAR